ncbi:MAG: dihydroneopterin aldolase [Bacteroidaceae bacterium]|nr:dihydroneopterin aldolase [Bacteroidaceae bacterium]
MPETSIIIKDLRIYAYHGVLPQERIIGDYFTINLRIDIDFTTAMYSDNINDTLNYASVCDIITSEMSKTSKLIEHVAGRICNNLLNKFQHITEIELEILKENPPMHTECQGAGVRIKLKK